MLALGLLDLPWWGVLLLIIVGYLVYSCRNFYFFRKQGVKGRMPVPLLGTTYTMFKESMAYSDMKLMEKYGDKGCCGEFFGSTPALMVFDRKMLSEIMVKDFTSFPNRMTMISNDNISSTMLLNLELAHWKHVRNEMSPTFTTGKLKKMNSEINSCANQLANHLLERARLHEVVRIEDYAGAFTMDVISSTAFGIQVDSQKDRNNAFVTNIKQALTFSAASPMVFIRLYLPEVVSLLMKFGLQIEDYPKTVTDFIHGTTRQAMEMRSDSDQSRTDFLQLMIKAQKGNKDSDDEEDKNTQEGEKNKRMGLTTNEILSNAMLFFFAGYDTTSTSLSFFLYNMALYPECQEKLAEEIKRVVGDKEFIDYNMPQEMPYLDMCINENLRLYPPAFRVNRKACKDVTVNGIFFKKDCLVQIPIYAIHHDPKRWPEPEKFDPERFSAENKKARNPHDFMPFGNGPRICIGMRLALHELKVAVIQVLRSMKVSTCDKTQIPMHFGNTGWLLKAENGIWLQISPRNPE